MSYIPKPLDTTNICLPDDLQELIEQMAENNHEVWAQERVQAGWTYGETRDDPGKQHPDLIPYAELPDHEQELDRKTTAGVLKFLMARGYHIVKT